jgi:NosR/NirI family transcriptional regulator, nitrous oxide reductase regulator
VPSSLHGLPLRLLRVALLALAVGILHAPPQAAPLTLGQISDLYPTAHQLTTPRAGLQSVLAADGSVLGYITQTYPNSADIIGYSGSSNLLLALDENQRVKAVRLLSSGDTLDHVAEVVQHRPFFSQFKGLELGQPVSQQVHGVSGATLTSAAMAESILRRLGTEVPSLRFPEEVTLAEAQQLVPEARSMRQSSRFPAGLELLSASQESLGTVLRSSPAADGVSGYQGPTECLLLLDHSGTQLRKLLLRRSYDNEAYVGYVTGDRSYLSSFTRFSMEQLSTLNFQAEGIEGVAGATQTSYAVAEGLRLRAAAHLASLQSPATAWFSSLHWRLADGVHLALLLTAALMAFSPLRGIVWLRRLHHAVLVLTLGAWLGEMLSLGLYTGWSQHGAPWRSAPGLVLLGSVALLAPIITRRQLYCHHICPHGALQTLVMRLARWQWQPKGRVALWLERLPYALLALLWLSVASRWGWNLGGFEAFDAYVWRVAGVSTLCIAVLGLIFSAFTPMAYCRYGCPTGALFKLLRYAGQEDHWSLRDWLATTFLAAGYILRHLL